MDDAGRVEHVIRAMMLVLIDPGRQPHLEDHEVRFLSHHLDCMARSTVAGVGDDTCVGPEDVAVRVHLLVVVHAWRSKVQPVPSISPLAACTHRIRLRGSPGSRGKPPLPSRSGHPWTLRIDDDRQGVVACSVGDVPSLEEQGMGSRTHDHHGDG